jgi:hypothetical protein
MEKCAKFRGEFLHLVGTFHVKVCEIAAESLFTWTVSICRELLWMLVW